jgi:hypothetical protein
MKTVLANGNKLSADFADHTLRIRGLELKDKRLARVIKLAMRGDPQPIVVDDCIWLTEIEIHELFDAAHREHIAGADDMTLMIAGAFVDFRAGRLQYTRQEPIMPVPPSEGWRLYDHLRITRYASPTRAHRREKIAEIIRMFGGNAN